MSYNDIKNNILQQSNIGIWVIEIEQGKEPRMIADACMRELLGVDETLNEEEVYNAWFDGIHPDYLDAVNSSVEKMISGKHAEVQYPWYHPTRGLIFVRCGGVRDESFAEGIRLQGSHQDISDILKFRKDELTGLYTKEHFFRRVEEILKENPDTEYRILVSDIENFKMINEKYGVETADELLKYLANAQKKMIPGNYILGARINADKFACLQYARKQSREEGQRMEAEVLKKAPVPNLVWKHGIYYTSFDRTISVQAMCDRARSAVDSIKGVYGVNCAVYDEKLREKILVQQLIEDNMEEALEKEEFQVYLQPKHDTKSDKLAGAEALIRWVHPTAGFMNPGQFIPLFEKNGFITRLDEYVITKVCRLLKKWKDEGTSLIPISVNLSRRDFERPDLDRQIIGYASKYDVDPRYLHIEITESVFSDNPLQTAEIVRRLHESGFVIELDDFGTGYSSLMTLNELELDIIKLDMSLIQKDKPGTERNVLDFCAQLTKMMKLKSVAEGVETLDQMKRMKEVGCDYIQGYFFSKPLPIKDFEEYLVVNM